MDNIQSYTVRTALLDACDQEEKSTRKARVIASTIALGVGLAAIATGVALAVTAATVIALPIALIAAGSVALIAGAAGLTVHFVGRAKAKAEAEKLTQIGVGLQIVGAKKGNPANLTVSVRDFLNNVDAQSLVYNAYLGSYEDKLYSICARIKKFYDISPFMQSNRPNQLMIEDRPVVERLAAVAEKAELDDYQMPWYSLQVLRAPHSNSLNVFNPLVAPSNVKNA